jgi:hypothetical protein
VNTVSWVGTLSAAGTILQLLGSMFLALQALRQTIEHVMRMATAQRLPLGVPGDDPVAAIQEPVEREVREFGAIAWPEVQSGVMLISLGYLFQFIIIATQSPMDASVGLGIAFVVLLAVWSWFRRRGHRETEAAIQAERERQAKRGA